MTIWSYRYNVNGDIDLLHKVIGGFFMPKGSELGEQDI